jgi:hypothetical protein
MGDRGTNFLAHGAKDGEQSRLVIVLRFGFEMITEVPFGDDP